MAEQTPVIALLSPGAMGSAIAARLTGHGARVLTSLAGRSPASAERAKAAGMHDASDAELARADIILSVVPPGDAEALAERLLPHLVAAENRPLYIDANALSPETKRSMAGRLESSGVAMVDGSIIGPPPRGQAGYTILYLAGPSASRGSVLGSLGLKVRVLDGPVGAASALKMCFAGINKGLVGLGSAMLLAAERAGAGDALALQMHEIMPDLVDRFRRQVPDMYAKAYRWIAEMREISAFLQQDPAAAMIFEGMAQLYERLAADIAGPQQEQAMLDRAIARSAPAER
ncbi:MAG: DUF1932 domain-containing protein [Sphingomonadales bacterium]